MNSLERYQIAANDLAEAQVEYTAALKALQASCSHDKVSECEWEQMEYIDSLHPRRICETCGVEEEGKSIMGGYKTLTCDRVRRVSRDTLYALRK